jgi:hypothetical protein
MTARRRPEFADPVDRPDSHSLSLAPTTAAERANARLTIALNGTDVAERRQLLDMLGLLDRAEINAQLAHHTKEAA